MRSWAIVVALGLLVTPAALASSAQVGFSPEGSGRYVVLGVIGRANKELRMLSYTFTAPDIAAALVSAKRRGVDVMVVVDAKGNQDSRSHAALNVLVNAGIPVRMDDRYPIQHDKTIIVDRRSVETGSFNFTSSAEKYNSENAVVIWDMPDLAAEFLKHWQSRWDQGADYRPGY